MLTKINLYAGKNIGRWIFVMILPIFFLLTALVSFTGEKINFSGEWSLNETKTNLGENYFNVLGTKLVINQQDSILSITRFTKGFDGQDLKLDEKYTLDGKECVNVIFNSSKKAIARWSDDGKSLVITSTILFNREGEQMEIKSTEVWKLSEDGNSISIDFNSTSGWGDLTQLYVFDKVKATQ